MDVCDFFTIDFDVAGRPLAEAVPIATTLRDWLVEVGLTGFPKTSGQSGLHVLVPIGEGQSFDTAVGLADLFGNLLARAYPEIATVERMRDKRDGKMYIDTKQTGASRTIVCPYSVRATPTASVSMPIPWDAVTRDLDPRAFTLRNVPAHVKAHGDAMAAFATTHVDMSLVLPRIEALVREVRPTRPPLTPPRM